jgi:ABC-2 type transport system permease protein
MWRRIWAITQKEFIQLFRYKFFFFSILFGTLVEVALFAAAIHTNIQHIPLAVADQSLSQASRGYLAALTSSGAFDIAVTGSGQRDLMGAIDRGQANLGILIPPDFAAQVKQRRASVLVLVDGSSSFITNSAYSMVGAISQSYAISLIPQTAGGHAASPLNLVTRILYNPDANELWFIIPGLVAAMIQGVTLNLTTLAIVREREVGTIEALLVTPIRPVELMLGKSIPNLLIAVTNQVMIIAFCAVAYGMPFRGNLPVYLLLAVLFSFSGLGLGLVISTAARTQLQAQLIGAMVNLVGFFLAGFMFPVYALPPLLRLLGAIFPMTYFLPITRGFMIKGVGIPELLPDVAGSVLLAVVIVVAASRMFRESLD